MTFPLNPAERSPKGDHNRRLALGLDVDEFASEAGISTDQLRGYEFTDVDGTFDMRIAELVGSALERLEARHQGTIDNGPKPGGETLDLRIETALHRDAFVERLSRADADSAEQLLGSELATIDPAIRVTSFGERPRGPLRELVVGWQRDSRAGETVIVLAA